MKIKIVKEKFCTLCGEEMIPDDFFHLDGQCMKQKAIFDLRDNSRNSIAPEWAEKIATTLGCQMNKKLIYTKVRYRECPNDPLKPRVCISDLASDICKQLGLEPDKDLMHLACQMSGEGSYQELRTFSYVKTLAGYFKVDVGELR
jgi:hypothetical protein